MNKSELKTCSFPGVSQAALKMINARAPATILDVGCYYGDVSRYLISAGYVVSSMDLIPYDGTEKLPDFHIVNAASDWPFLDSQFDIVVCTEVIEHVDAPTRLLKEAARVLKPGGEFVISTPLVNSLSARLTFLLTGHLYQFGHREFHEWGHISPVTADWIIWEAAKHSMKCSEVRCERAEHGWKRWLVWRLLWPVQWIFKRQTGALLDGHSVILRLVRPV